MSLDMYNTIDVYNRSVVPGGVFLIVGTLGGYTGPGGVWQAVASPDPVELNNVVIQPVSLKTAEMLSTALGGVRMPDDMRTVYINDGTQIYSEDTARAADIVRFSDGLSVRDWKVIRSDNRPWRNYCKAVVERYKGTG